MLMQSVDNRLLSLSFTLLTGSIIVIVELFIHLMQLQDCRWYWQSITPGIFLKCSSCNKDGQSVVLLKFILALACIASCGT